MIAVGRHCVAVPFALSFGLLVFQGCIKDDNRRLDAAAVAVGFDLDFCAIVL